jgi:phosphatidylglycerol:prolipoprotein diacylglycerol transferase
MVTLAEIPFLRIDPILVEIGSLKVRWYGVSYVLAFAAAFLVLRSLAKKRRWPVAPEQVADVLFWGILGVFIGGRLGWAVFYASSQPDWDWSRIYRVWEGGMSFHGGLLGVIVAYLIYARQMGVRKGELFDGLALATTPGLVLVRLANYVNAELYGRVTTGPLGVRFPDYPKVGGSEHWVEGGPMLPDLRHASQLYEALGEGLLLYLVLSWLMLKKGVGGGRISALFLMIYGGVRFLIEFTREPDPGLGFPFLGLFTRGQQLCLGMVVAGIVVWLMCGRKPAEPEASPA